jgi:hypothetical protein
MARSVGGMSGRGKREDMLPPLKRHEIQVLRRAGHSQAEVARLAEVSVRTVRRVEEESNVVEVDTRKQVKERGVGRPSKTEPLRAFVVDVLAKEPELMSLEVLRRARLRGYGGSKSAMYQLIAEVRPKPAKPVVRFEGLPGEFSQHDFGEVDVRFVDGRRKRVVFFASRLKYSRWVQVTIVPDQQVESLVRTLVEHFEAIGGVPLVAVFDRPKTVVISSKKDWSYEHFLGTLVAEEVAHRKGTRLRRLSSIAHFPFLKTIDDFDFTFQSTLRLQVLGSYLSPDFVTQGGSLSLIGKTGRGKTHLAIAIAYRAIQNGFDARFVTAAELIDELALASREVAVDVERFERAKRRWPALLRAHRLGTLGGFRGPHPSATLSRRWRKLRNSSRRPTTSWPRPWSFPNRSAPSSSACYWAACRPSPKRVSLQGLHPNPTRSSRPSCSDGVGPTLPARWNRCRSRSWSTISPGCWPRSIDEAQDPPPRAVGAPRRRSLVRGTRCRARARTARRGSRSSAVPLRAPAQRSRVGR